MEIFRWILQMPHMVVKDCRCSSGGLVLFWRREVDLTIKSLSRYHIDALVREDDGRFWRLTGVYGEQKADEKERTWRLLRILNNQ